MPPCITPLWWPGDEHDFLCRSGSVGSVGKVVGLPVYKLLGGAVRDEISSTLQARARIWQKRWALSVQNADALGAT